MELLLVLSIGFAAGVLYARRRGQPSAAEQAKVRARLRHEF